MKHLPFTYPSDDDQKYLSFFDGAFPSVFIALNPFAQHLRLQPTPHYEVKSERESALLKELGATVAVTWQEIAELCAFPSVQHVNRALRGTGSNRIDPKFGNTADTETLLKACADIVIELPEEGHISPLSELFIGKFISDLGHQSIYAASHFGTDVRVVETKNFMSNTPVFAPELCAQDNSFYLAQYIDYHYFLVCQTQKSRSRANPADYFEGFFAVTETDDFWGIGNL